MKNGLYKVSFNTPLGQGNGIVVVHDGLIQGGDSSMFYLGTFQEVDNHVTASIRVGKHSDVPGIRPVFGRDDVNAKLQGTSTENSATIQGFAAEAPGVLLKAQLTLIVQ